MRLLSSHQYSKLSSSQPVHTFSFQSDKSKFHLPIIFYSLPSISGQMPKAQACQIYPNLFPQLLYLATTTNKIISFQGAQNPFTISSVVSQKHQWAQNQRQRRYNQDGNDSLQNIILFIFIVINISNLLKVDKCDFADQQNKRILRDLCKLASQSHDKALIRVSQENRAQVNTQEITKKNLKNDEVQTNKDELMGTPELARIFFESHWLNEQNYELVFKCHHQQMGMQMQPNQVNPDMMTYERLLQLGDSISKVSKGISKQQFNNLERFKNIAKNKKLSLKIQKLSFAQLAIREISQKQRRKRNLWKRRWIQQWRM